MVAVTPPPPPPTPAVQAAKLYVPDAIAALRRAGEACYRAQLDDALRSAEMFIDLMKQANKK